MTERQARIEAAMTALFHGERGDVALGYYTVRSRMDTALAAADAAAAPAVGVTGEQAEALIDELLASLDGSADWEFDDKEEARYAAARNRIIALLTAPEPGTHDDAGQPAEGGVTG